MEKIGTSYISVIEPPEFNAYELKFNYDTFGVVFFTQSK